MITKDLVHGVIDGILWISIILTFCFNVIWLIKCIIKFCIVLKKYQTCKRTPNLHPIHRDVQYLSQQRKLYNLKTHYVKYALIVLCISVELICHVWFLVFQIIQPKLVLNRKQSATITEIEQEYPNCNLDYQLLRMYFFPSYIILANVNYFLFFLLFVSLSILTRYLAARYFNHPFRTILTKYLVWLFLQFLIVSICSTIYTLLLSFILFPLLSIINWLVLLRDNRLLCRNLKSNLREIELFAYTKTLYREQLLAFRLYRVFQKVLLLSLFFISLIGTFHQVLQLSYIIFDSYCILNIIYGFNISIDAPYLLPSNFIFQFQGYANIILSLIGCLYSFSTLFPLILITFSPLIWECFKRYKYRHIVYRYNYDNVQPLLRRQ